MLFQFQDIFESTQLKGAVHISRKEHELQKKVSGFG